MKELSLEICGADPKTRKIWILEKKKQFVLGRNPQTSDILIEHESLSRRHALIMVTEGGSATIQDLNSVNGTFVDGKRILINQLVLLRRDTQIHLAECPHPIIVREKIIESEEELEPEPKVEIAKNEVDSKKVKEKENERVKERENEKEKEKEKGKEREKDRNREKDKEREKDRDREREGQKGDRKKKKDRSHKSRSRSKSREHSKGSFKDNRGHHHSANTSTKYDKYEKQGKKESEYEKPPQKENKKEEIENKRSLLWGNKGPQKLTDDLKITTNEPDKERNIKFLKLMGLKQSDIEQKTAELENKEAVEFLPNLKSEVDDVKRNEDLEKQFNVGMKRKDGRKVGLGWAE